MEKGKLSNIENLYKYMLDNSIRETEVLQRLRVETQKDASSIMQIPIDQGQLMALLVKLIGAKRTIEIGVYTGYSALCVAQAMPNDSYTIACDVNEAWTAIAKKYWKEANVAHKIDLIIAPAVDTLKSLLSLKLLRKGGLMVIDNVLLFGSVMDSTLLDESLRDSITENSIQAIRDLNVKIKNDGRIDMSMLQIADGITLVCKR